jgi:branched-chain amino acid transport system ATP-binding protein
VNAGRETLLRVDGVELSFAALRVLNDFTLDVHAGDVVGLVGPNGAGKTSLLNCINRIYLQQQGSIEFCGERIDKSRPDQVARMGMARTFQTPTAFREMRVIEVVMVGRHIRMPSRFGAYLMGVPHLNGVERRERERCIEVLELLGIGRLAEAELGSLPQGEAKLVDLARALASEPQLLLLDEPASGLSPTGRGEMAETLRHVREQLRITVVIVEHDMTLVQRVCDRVVVMKDGAKLADGPPQQTLADPAVVEALLGVPTAAQVG